MAKKTVHKQKKEFVPVPAARRAELLWTPEGGFNLSAIMREANEMFGLGLEPTRSAALKEAWKLAREERDEENWQDSDLPRMTVTGQTRYAAGIDALPLAA